MNGSQLTQLPEVIRILQLAKRLEEISVPSAAKLLKKSPKFIRANLPLIVHGPRSHHVRLSDIEAYQLRRTIRPLKTPATEWDEKAEHDHDLEQESKRDYYEVDSNNE